MRKSLERNESEIPTKITNPDASLAMIEHFNSSDMTAETYLAITDSNNVQMYGERQLTDINNRTNVYELFDRAMKYKKIILISQVKLYLAESLTDHFSTEFIEAAKTGLRLIVKNKIAKGESAAYFRYCLGSLERGLIPMDENTWKPMTARDLLRWYMEKGSALARTGPEEVRSWTVCSEMAHCPLNSPERDKDDPPHKNVMQYQRICEELAEKEQGSESEGA